MAKAEIGQMMTQYASNRDAKPDPFEPAGKVDRQSKRIEDERCEPGQTTQPLAAPKATTCRFPWPAERQSRTLVRPVWKRPGGFGIFVAFGIAGRCAPAAVASSEWWLRHPFPPGALRSRAVVRAHPPGSSKTFPHCLQRTRLPARLSGASYLFPQTLHSAVIDMQRNPKLPCNHDEPPQVSSNRVKDQSHDTI